MLLQRGRTNRRQNRHKIAALALAGMMMVSFVTAGPTTARADTAAVTKAAITVTNIDAADNAALKAYKIVGKDANGNWSPVIEGSIADVTKPTAAEITALAGKTDQLGTGLELATTDHKTYSKGDLDFGTYLVLVEQNDGVKNIYNPMIVSINDDKGNAQAGTVDAAGNFTTTDGTTAFAKKSPVDITKKVTNSDQNNEKGSTLTGTGTTDAKHADGTEVTEATFRIDTTIPYYSDAYTTVTFDVSDTVSEGLDAPKDIKVSVGGTDVAASADKYTLTQEGK
ncbi:MAG: isopeptide-forming domain-containing fimbrial protein, partial [Eubacterium sp.]